MYDFHIDSIVSFIERRNARTVALQLPEGLKTYALNLADQIGSRTGARCLILGDPCYGACDINRDFRRYAEALVHIGHAEIPSMQNDADVVHIEVQIDFDPEALLEKALPLLRGTVGVVTTVQHTEFIDKALTFLRSKGVKCVVGRGDQRIKHPGQLLGCNISAATSVDAEVDSYLFIGSGNFHPLSVAIETSKEVIVMDPVMNEVREIGELKERIMRQRHAAIARSADVEDFGIIVSSKTGQDRFPLAMDLLERIERKGKKATVIILEEISPERLLPFQCGAFVSTACPRLAIDDQLRYPKPMLTPIELEIVLGDREWADYHLDMIMG
ncbi:MAG: diphthamide biosynthesis enzyme Dph2 [Methanomassiliicoccales archaeon]|nr:MAG: diphthamide biosynthesis enzyme Dph2 [Methanomassiliicoccales archaeon]